jgi:exosortase
MGRYKTLARFLVLAGLFGYLYLPVFRELVRQWSTDVGTLGYGFFIPPVAAYLVWERRLQLRANSGEHSWWGYVVLLVGLMAFLVGRAGNFDVVAEGSLIVVLFGIVLFLGGWRLTKQLAFPLVFLAFMIPPPSDIFYRITWPLQLFTAQFSTEVLRFVGYPVLLQGIYIDLPQVRLEVAAACSGFRSLISLAAMGVLLAFLTQSGWPNRALLVASVLPIAILSNAVRVASNILIGTYEGTYHTINGWIVFVLAAGCMMGVAVLLAKRATPRVVA